LAGLEASDQVVNGGWLIAGGDEVSLHLEGGDPSLDLLNWTHI